MLQNFGHTISGISEPPPRRLVAFSSACMLPHLGHGYSWYERLLMSSRGEANSEEHNCNGGEDEDGGRGAETN